MDKLRVKIPVLLVVFSATGYLTGIFMFNSLRALDEFQGYSFAGIAFFFILLSISSGFCCEFILNVLNQKLPWKKFMLARFCAGYVLCFITTALLVFVTGAILNPFGKSLPETPVLINPLLQIYYKLAVIYGFILLIFNILHLTLYSYQTYFISSLKLKMLKRKQMDLHIEALKNQITPHYLFNNLNTISGLNDPVKAENYIRHFAASCRFILENSRNLLIPLSREIEFVKSYVFLMETRFEGMFKTEFLFQGSIENLSVPPLGIQLLVENAIKHNTLNIQQPLHIKIYNEKNDYLVVENNITGSPTSLNLGSSPAKSPELKSTGTGLSNLALRFEFITSKPLLIENNGNFTVKIPIIPSTKIKNATKVT
ncbi:MAG: histidine kinase [Bacteroidales bacterium]